MCEALSGALERLVLTKDTIIKILSKQEILLMVLPRHVKKTIRKFLCGEGENGTHTLDGGHVQMATVDPKSQMKSLLSNCTWLE